MLRMIRNLVSLLLFGLSVLFGYLYYGQYYRWRDCFDEAGRCFDAQYGVVHLEQSGMTWATLTVLTVTAAILLRWFARAGR